MDVRDRIAARVAKELKDGDLVNLGFGIPSLVANFISKDKDVILHAENGFINVGPAPDKDHIDPDLTNASAQPATIQIGGAFFDLEMSIGIIRGGHLDMTVLGALQVSEEGDIANWCIPGEYTPGMGGAMDLILGSKQVIVAMEHSAKGNPKILEKCILPLTAIAAVNMIVTELAVFTITNKKMTLVEYSDTTTLDEIKKLTQANYTVSSDVKHIEF